ncbi:unnamed protein product [Callosobruchus maculatus]|uniref:Plasma membrane calcium transporting P-type ATPase C-terminal domain-containing protein n=1 Tax=Callosobruchus maculatus TaxID=64391 RepID=A0A653CLR9_CALMS|nr:unnamed protein product [Callosobruchus maculatus]
MVTACLFRPGDKLPIIRKAVRAESNRKATLRPERMVEAAGLSGGSDSPPVGDAGIGEESVGVCRKMSPGEEEEETEASLMLLRIRTNLVPEFPVVLLPILTILIRWGRGHPEEYTEAIAIGEEKYDLDSDKKPRAGQILWIRGLTRLQTQVIGGELQERLIPVPYSKSSTDQAVGQNHVSKVTNIW